MWRPEGGLLLAASLILLAGGALALYEDQVGVVDWYKDNIGEVTHAVVHPAANQRRAFVGTRHGVVASINMRTGQSFWRQVLPEGEDVRWLEFDGKTLFSVSGPCKSVRAWNPTSGALSWDDQAFSGGLSGEAACEAAVTRDVNEDEMPDLALLANNAVRFWSGADGHRLWSWEDSSAEGAHTNYLRLVARSPASATGGGAGSRHLHVVGVQRREGEGAAQLVVVTLDAARGSQLSRETIAAPGEAEAMRRLIVVSNRLVLWLGQQETGSGEATLYGHRLGQKQQLHSFGVHSFFPVVSHVPAGTAMELLPNRLPDAFIMRVGAEHAAAVRVAATAEDERLPPAMQLIHEFDKPGRVFSEGSVDGKGVPHLASAVAGGDGQALALEVLNLRTGLVAAQGPVAALAPREHGPPLRLFLSTVSRKEEGALQRALVVTADHQLSLHAGGELLWQRHEALASVVKIRFGELPQRSVTSRPRPELEEEAPLSGALHELLGSLRRRALVDLAEDAFSALDQLRRLAGLAAPAPGRAREEAPAELTADRFGFRRLLFLLTEPGKLFALHTERGAILWSRYLPGPAGPGARPAALRALLAEAPHGPSPGAVLVVTEAAVLRFRSTTGEELGRHALPSPATHAALLHEAPGEAHAAHRAGPVLVVATEAARLLHFPETPEAAAAVARRAGSIALHTVDRAAGTVTGCRVVAPASGAGLECEASWLFSLPPHEALQRVFYPPEREAVHVAVKVVRDREVHYKYVNPNLMLVAATSAPHSLPGAGPKGAPRLVPAAVSVYAVDGVTGAVVHAATHRHARGPVAAALSEHTLVYHYWNEEAQQFEVASVELQCEPEGLSLATPSLALRGLLSLKPPRSEREFSSFTAPAPSAVRQTYVFSTAIRAIGVTQTARGITPKHLLLALASEQLMALDRRFVDARRPVGPVSQAEREEGIVPYNPRIFVYPQLVLSYNLTLHRVREVATAPATLESSSHVLAWGLDLFYTRHAPAKQFDLLNDDFNKGLLLATCTGVVAATLLAYWVAKAREAAVAWK
eukprot:tig00000970_g5830.t1